MKLSEARDLYLEHHGVKGQKWGVRRKRGANGRVDPKSLSDEQLRAAVNRMNMEQQYSRLSSSGTGRRGVSRILANGATLNTAIAFGRSPAGRIIATTLAAGAASAIPLSRAISSIGRTEIR